MSNNTLIKVDNIDFEYDIFSKSKNLCFCLKIFLKKNEKHTHLVFKNFTCHLDKGEFLGISGKNGSGKTTLLRLMSKIFLPTRGNIDLKYPIKNPLINLSSGMLQNCNALENIMLKYLYAGMSKQDAINDTRKYLILLNLVNLKICHLEHILQV